MAIAWRVLAGLCLLVFGAATSADQREEPVWVSDSPHGRQVHLYFFWSRACPHCQAALPVVQDLEVTHAWLSVHSYEITQLPANAGHYVAMAEALGEEARAVPAFFVCGQMLTGFDSAGGRGQELFELARACRDGELPLDDTARVGRVPVLGDVDADGYSLPVLTLLLAGLDAFNPCAFFVLLFLLSLLVHTRSRARMLLVGGVFVFFSGLVYFLFMAAWLNLFLVIQGSAWVTTAAGLVAVVIGLLNTKDFFTPGRGPSLSMSDDARRGLAARVRKLLAADRLPVLLGGTVLLALAANSYELLCTAGFPMVYTRVLTLAELPGGAYYGYLLLYNLIYVLPLLIIVLAFVLTLGRHRLSERQGRNLKLLSGLMMLGLGSLLLLAPQALVHAWTGAGLLAAALVLTGLLAGRARSPRQG